MSGEFEIEYDKFKDDAKLNDDQLKFYCNLKELDIRTSTCFHDAAFTVEQAKENRGAIKGGHCKNLFMKDKLGEFYLIVTLEDAMLKINQLHKLIGSKRLSFAKSEYLEEYLKISHGSVTPFAIMNDKEQMIKVVLDKKMLQHDVINFHPLLNTATTSIYSDDLIKFIKRFNNEPLILDLY